MKKNLFFYILITIFSLTIFLFVVIPLAKMILAANPKMIIESLKDKEISASILLSLKASLISTIIAIVTGVPLAYALTRWNFKGKSFLEAIMDIPVMIPHTAAGIALLSVYGSNFILGKFFGIFGLKFVGTEAGIIIGMMFVSVSYLVNHAKEGFKRIDIKMENVARSLGASPGYIFFHINLPLVKKDITSGAIMMWARGISEFGAVVILTYNPMTAPILILERFNSFGLSYSRPVAVLLILICIILFTVLRWVNNKK